KHRIEWLGDLAGVVQHREGLEFDRGLLVGCQVQIKSLAALDKAIGSPLWGAIRKMWFCDRYAWDPRIAPLIATPLMRQLREVVCIGENNVFPTLAGNTRPLPITAIWTSDDHHRHPVNSIRDVDAMPGLPALERLGFYNYRHAEEIVHLPIVRRIS